MERIEALINQLQTLHQQNASPAELLATVQLLHSALLRQQQRSGGASGSKVAVSLPLRLNIRHEERKEDPIPAAVPLPQPLRSTPVAEAPAPQPEPVREEKREPVAEQPPVAPAEPEPLPAPAPEVKSVPLPIQEAKPQTEEPPAPTVRQVYPGAVPSLASYHVPQPDSTEPVPTQRAADPLPQPSEPAPAPGYALRKPAVAEMPDEHASYLPKTAPAPAELPAVPVPPAAVAQPAKEIFELSTPREVHEMIAGRTESLNDRLKQQKTEVAHAIKDAPIKDLRRGVGVNDRFTFVNELFRGDEAMYERSIKTINGFHILPEAEYWINRELTVKLGWDEQKPTVQHFYQLVRRRFA